MHDLFTKSGYPLVTKIPKADKLRELELAVTPDSGLPPSSWSYASHWSRSTALHVLHFSLFPHFLYSCFSPFRGWSHQAIYPNTQSVDCFFPIWRRSCLSFSIAFVCSRAAQTTRGEVRWRENVAWVYTCIAVSLRPFYVIDISLFLRGFSILRYLSAFH